MKKAELMEAIGESIARVLKDLSREQTRALALHIGRHMYAKSYSVPANDGRQQFIKGYDQTVCAFKVQRASDKGSTSFYKTAHTLDCKSIRENMTIGKSLGLSVAQVIALKELKRFTANFGHVVDEIENGTYYD
tara:strand:- start:62 stop:463 length:402 start_codon:yes stop_codon:yes gene_type:complete